ncbi:MAG: hypothetical protein EPN23_03770, partial [Verrucomicrobia bacterium]
MLGGGKMNVVFLTNSSRRIVSFLSATLIAVCLWPQGAGAQATNFYWTNTINSGWSTAANWTNGAPASGGQTNYVLNFGAPATYTSTNDLGDGFVLNGLNITTGVGVVTLAGNSLVFTNNGTIAPSINFNAGANSAIGNNLVFGATTTNNISSITRFNGVISGAGGLIKSGAAALMLTSNNTYSGGTIINGGTLYVGASGANGSLGTGDVTINSGGLLLFQRTTAATVSNNIAGVGAVSQRGDAATWVTTLSGNNTYTGDTSVYGGSMLIITGTNSGGGTINVGYTNAAGANSILKIQGGSVSSSTFYVGAGFGVNGLTGTVYQASNATVGVNVSVVLGQAANSYGEYHMDGGTLNTGYIDFGNTSNAIGRFYQTTGTVVVSSSINVGRVAGGYGEYHMDGGALNVGQPIYLGYASGTTGRFYQTAGTVTAATVNVVLGSSTNSYGEYHMDGGTLNANAITFGNLPGATGRFYQTTGTVSAGVSVNLGQVAGGYGEYHLDGGTLKPTSLYLGYASGTTGRFYQTAGTLNATNSVYVGASGYGEYYLYGGTLNSTGDVILGLYSNTKGVFTMTNGQLNARSLFVGRPNGGPTNTAGYYYQSGGTTFVTNLYIGGVGGATTTTNTYGYFAVSNGTFTANVFNSLAGSYSSTGQMYLGQGSLVNLPAFPTARGSNSYADITFDGGTLSPTAASTTYLQGLDHAYLTTNGAIFSVQSGKDIMVQQVLENAAGQAGTLTKTGGGSLLLSATNTYTGVTVINNGELTLDLDNALPSTGAVFINGSGARYNLNTLTTVTNGAIALDGGGIISNGTLVGSSYAMSNGTVYARLAGAGALTKGGAGTVTLMNANTYSGGTTVSNGVLQLGVDNALPTTTTLYVDSLGTVDLNGKNQTLAG